MPRNARVVAPGIPYHVTQRGTNREQVFFAIGDRKLYLQLVRENLSEAGVRILAYCLMTNIFISLPYQNARTRWPFCSAGPMEGIRRQ